LRDRKVVAGIRLQRLVLNNKIKSILDRHFYAGQAAGRGAQFYQLAV
jgi:hypothetical protein